MGCQQGMGRLRKCYHDADFKGRLVSALAWSERILISPFSAVTHFGAPVRKTTLLA